MLVPRPHKQFQIVYTNTNKGKAPITSRFFAPYSLSEALEVYWRERGDTYCKLRRYVRISTMAMMNSMIRSICKAKSMQKSCRMMSSSSSSSSSLRLKNDEALQDGEVSSVVGRPVAAILRELNRRIPANAIKVHVEDGFTNKYVPWHILNRIMNLHAEDWSGEVRSIAYSNDGKSVTVVYRVTIYGTDTEVFRESTGTASTEDTNFGDPVQKAEAMAFRRACARLGLGLHLYHEELL